jgi:hypothetical protein
MGISELEIDDPDLYTDLYQCHVCPAFPAYPGIPPEITNGDNPHDEIYEGQVGDYVYQMKTKKEEDEEKRKYQEFLDEIEDEEE